MPIVSSFPAVANTRARVLILGSMPGVASLRRQQYYAHPRNAFWPLLAAICGFATDLPYAARLAALRRRGIALWDVLQSCARAGSLDSDIERDSQRVNDFAPFFAARPQLRLVACNGGTAFRLFRQQVLPGLQAAWTKGRLSLAQLPSTSPAHASLGWSQKLAAWRRTLGPFLA